MKKVFLSDLAVSIIDGDRGKNYPKSGDFSINADCLFLSAKNVTDDGFKFSELQFISDKKDSLMGKGKLRRNDIVITTRGTVGNIAWFNNAVPYHSVRINSGMVIIRNESLELDTEFLYKTLNSKTIKNQIKRTVFGSAQPQLTLDLIRDFKISLPPLLEQQKIAAILRTWDDAIEKIEKLISTYQKQKNLIRNEILKPLTGWQKKALGDVCVLHYGKGINRDHYAEDGDTYVYGTSGQIGKTKLEHQFLGPSIVIGRKGTINYPILIDSGQKFRVIDTAYFLETKENVTFLFYLIDALNLLKLNEASGVPSLSRDTLYNIKINFPSIIEQKKIAEVLVAADNAIDCLKKKKILFQTQKRGLMQKLLTGDWLVKANQMEAV